MRSSTDARTHKKLLVPLDLNHCTTAIFCWPVSAGRSSLADLAIHGSALSRCLTLQSPTGCSTWPEDGSFRVLCKIPLPCMLPASPSRLSRSPGLRNCLYMCPAPAPYLIRTSWRRSARSALLKRPTPDHAQRHYYRFSWVSGRHYFSRRTPPPPPTDLDLELSEYRVVR